LEFAVHQAILAKVIPDDIGVVAIGRNEGKRLVACLVSLKSDSHNIIYVDSGSSDGSVMAAEQLGVGVVTLDLTRPFTAARARNEGFAALRKISPNVRFVQFIDGDCILVHDWLDKAHSFIENRSDIAIVCGRRRERHPTESLYNRFCDIEWDTPIGETLACGGDALVRAEAFEAVGGFRASLIAGEEPELCLRLRKAGWKIWRLNAEMTRHDAAMTRIGQWWMRAVRCGYAYAEVSRLHKSSQQGIWRRETKRAVFWAGVLPLIICLGTLISPAALGGALAYPLQICRIAIARGVSTSQSWTYALFATVAKFAEFQGIMRFYWREFGRQTASPIEYK
jgi:GT2 family glycosyltransferase